VTEARPYFKTQPRAHQLDLFEKHCDSERFALHWEMGLGKTWELLSIASYLRLRNKIDVLLVLAPNAVYPNWLTTEAPKHMAADYVPFRYRVGGSQKKQAKRALFLMQEVVDPRTKLRVVAMAYSALITDDGFQFVQRLTTLYRTMIVCDESSKIKNGQTQTAKKAKKIGLNCHYRWNATGTPVSRSPFDVHSQIEFLDEDYWKRYGCKSITAFRQEFGVFGARQVSKTDKNGNTRTMKFQEVVDYRNLDKLNRWLEPIASRLLKEDSGVELPPKVYKTIRFEMTPEQKKAYTSLRKQFVAELEGGATVEAPMAIVRLIRLAQIASGFVKVTKVVEMPLNFTLTAEGGDAIRALETESEVRQLVPPGENPRLLALQEVLEHCLHNVIVWCAFTPSVDMICELLGDKAVRYDGHVKERQREEGLARWRSGKAPILVANTRTISMGLTLTEAKDLIYYENTHILEDRLQSEDRAHRIGQDTSINIIDLCAEGTVNEKLLENLMEKYSMAAAVNGDRYREWLELTPEEEE